MALPNIFFTNNLGTITLTNALIELADEWTWTNAVVSHSKRFRISSRVSRQDAINFGLVSTNEGTQNAAGQPGSLTLPWTVLPRVLLQSIEMDDQIWMDWIPVTMEFVDDDPDHTRYIISFFGVDLVDPRFTIQLPFQAVHDEYVTMPMTSVAVAGGNPAYGPIRTLQTHEDIVCAFTGSYLMPTPPNMALLLETLSQRGGTALVNPTILPIGWPVIFNMADFSTYIANDFPLTNLWVTGSTLDWDVEKGQADVTIQMECPPQV